MPIITTAIALDFAAVYAILYSQIEAKTKIVLALLCAFQCIAFAYHRCKESGPIGISLLLILMCGGNAAMIVACGKLNLWVPIIPIAISCIYKALCTFFKLR